MVIEVGFGIIGCAGIARKIARAISQAPNATLVAIASRSLSKAEALKSEIDLEASVRVYGDYESLLDDPSVDAVYIPLPTSLHVKWAVAAAEKKKHVLLEKPTAMNVAELDSIIQACEVNGVEFMDGTMFVHHPRMDKMKEIISDPWQFGQLKMVHCNFAYYIAPSLLRGNIRSNPDLDGLGALGDAGWYCIRSILWATDYKLPNSVVANRNPAFNESGVLLSCGASLIWEDGLIATFDCSFQSRISMDLCVAGTNGIIHLTDFVIPFNDTSASFTLSTNSSFTDPTTAGQEVVDFADPIVAWQAAGYGSTGWQEPLPSEQVVRIESPQETKMIVEFSKLVLGVRDEQRLPEMKWAVMARKTQLVVDSVMASIENEFKPALVHPGQG